MSLATGFRCAGCGEWNETVVDESAGNRQAYVEDCQVCCKPNMLASRMGPLGQGIYHPGRTGKLTRNAPRHLLRGYRGMIFGTGGANRRKGRKLGSGPSVTYNRPFRSVDKILRSRGVPILPVSSGSSNSQIQKQQLPRRIFGSTYRPITLRLFRRRLSAIL